MQVESMSPEGAAHYRKLKSLIAVFDAELATIDNALAELKARRDQVVEQTANARKVLAEIEKL